MGGGRVYVPEIRRDPFAAGDLSTISSICIGMRMWIMCTRPETKRKTKRFKDHGNLLNLNDIIITWFFSCAGDDAMAVPLGVM